MSESVCINCEKGRPNVSGFCVKCRAPKRVKLSRADLINLELASRFRAEAAEPSANAVVWRRLNTKIRLAIKKGLTSTPPMKLFSKTRD
jgi:hypothetical protein